LRRWELREGSALACTNSFAKLVVHALRNDPIRPQVHAPVQAMPPTKEVAAVTKLKAQAIGNKT